MSPTKPEEMGARVEEPAGMVGMVGMVGRVGRVEEVVMPAGVVGGTVARVEEAEATAEKVGRVEDAVVPAMLAGKVVMVAMRVGMVAMAGGQVAVPTHRCKGSPD